MVKFKKFKAYMPPKENISKTIVPAYDVVNS